MGNLQTEVEARQKKIDVMSAKIEGMKKDYEEKKKDKNVSPADFADREVGGAKRIQ